MSTFNGEKFIKKQIESIQKQTYENWTLYIHDDGSTDGTISILNEISKNDSRIKFSIENGKFGPKDAFLKLFDKIDADYYLFCDQDDIWKPDKIERLITSINSYDNSLPLLIYSNLKCIDNNDEEVSNYSNFEKLIATDITKYDHFQMNNIPGCTMMVNKALKNKFENAVGGIASQIDNSQIIMHDWWLVLIAATFGKIIHENKTLVLYRQHANNTVGAGKGMSLFQKVLNTGFIKMFNTISNSFSDSVLQAREFYKLYLINEETNKMTQFIDKYQSYSDMSFLQRISFLKKYNLTRLGMRSTLIFKIIFIFSR
ncbi:glycosyltransferase family 2 protein [Ligilactobacillus sp. LYQ135]